MGCCFGKKRNGDRYADDNGSRGRQKSRLSKMFTKAGGMKPDSGIELGRFTLTTVTDDFIASMCGLSQVGHYAYTQDTTLVFSKLGEATPIKSLKAHDRFINQITSCQNMVYTASADRKVKMWNSQCENMAPLATFTGHELAVTSLTTNADNTLLATGGKDYRMKIFDVEKTTEICGEMINRNVITSLRWFPNEDSTILQTGEDLQMRIWDIRVDEIKADIVVPVGKNFAICNDISPDGNHIITGHRGFDGVGCGLKLWDRRNLSQCVNEFIGHNQSVETCLFGSVPFDDGRRDVVASVSKDASLRIFDIESGDGLTIYNEGSHGALTAMCRIKRENAPADDFSVLIGSVDPKLYALNIGKSAEIVLMGSSSF